jgi:hypothetical protein
MTTASQRPTLVLAAMAVFFFFVLLLPSLSLLSVLNIHPRRPLS